MLTKIPDNPSPRFLKNKKTRILLGAFLLLIYSGIIFILGVLAHRDNVVNTLRFEEVKQTLLFFKKPLYLFKNLLETPHRITIDINYKNYSKLAFDRKNALENRNKSFDYVSANLVSNGKTSPIKIRLKGDRRIHFEDKEKWSFRIKTKGENTVFGMKWFSLQKPRARNYIYEWLFHEVLRREGLIALRYKFVHLVLNGKDLGLYALEEHFGKRLLENNRFKEGPIVRFSESFHTDYYFQTVEPFESKKWITPQFKAQLQHAVTLLEAFRSGKMKVSDVFDAKKLATYFAITDLMGTRHGSIQKSLRFYYNPITTKLEPIGYDGHYGAFWDNATAMEIGINPGMAPYKTHYKWFAKFFNDKKNFDPLFFKEYVAALKRVAEPAYLDGLFKELAAPLETKLAMIYKDFPPFKDHIITYGPEIFRFRKGGFGTKQRVIKNLLALRKGIPAYYKSATSSGLTLEIANTRKMPVELLGVYYKPADLLLPSNGKKIVVPQVANRLMEYEEIHFKFPPGFRWEEGKARDLELRFRVLGTRRETGCEVYPWQRLNDGFLKKGLTHRPANMKAFDFVTVDEGLAEVRFKPGQWVLKKSMIIPPGYTVIAAEGFRLKLLNFSAIVSRSPLQFLGSEENPIIISSAGSGQGLVVMDTARESLLDHVVFDGLSNPATEGWELTGAVTFYKAPLKMTSCRFSKNRCEDALNVVSSHFELVGCKFDSIFSDALDSDFCKGKIMDCVFTGCGNDAVDVSGSIIEAGDLFIDGVGDKGLSVGENSEMTALRISIKNAELAVTAKDSSKLVINRSKIEQCKIGLTAYRKKPEFNGASIFANHVTLNRVKIPWLLEKGSRALKNGKKLVADKTNVKDILYGKQYGKSSK